jgi:energy-coupling factor transporter ATP-binding protein EcfA2
VTGSPSRPGEVATLGEEQQRRPAQRRGQFRDALCDGSSIATDEAAQRRHPWDEKRLAFPISAVANVDGAVSLTLTKGLGTRPAVSGRVSLTGVDVAGLSDRALAAVRATRMGFVFQQFFLSEHQTALDNVADGLLYRSVHLTQRRQAAEAALDQVGLGDRRTARPTQLSGGDSKIGGQGNIFIGPSNRSGGIDVQDLLNTLTLLVPGIAIVATLAALSRRSRRSRRVAEPHTPTT